MGGLSNSRGNSQKSAPVKNSHGNSQESASAKNIRGNSKSSASTRHTRATIWMILPLYIFTLIFVACPLIYMVALSFATPRRSPRCTVDFLHWIITGRFWNQCTWIPCPVLPAGHYKYCFYYSDRYPFGFLWRNYQQAAKKESYASYAFPSG